MVTRSEGSAKPAHPRRVSGPHGDEYGPKNADTLAKETRTGGGGGAPARWTAGRRIRDAVVATRTRGRYPTPVEEPYRESL